jgi:diphthine synthase
MTLYLIGLGLNDEKDITIKGLNIVKNAKKVYFETYTSLLNCDIKMLERVYNKKIVLADRTLVENEENKIIKEAKKEDIAFLVAGDPMSATTHIDLMLRARKNGIEVEVIHNASILTAIGLVGLDLYKYGRTISIVFKQENWAVDSYYDMIKENNRRGLHTLCLLDIKAREKIKQNKFMKNNENMKNTESNQFMTVNEAIKNLLEIEERRKEKVFTKKTICVGCARIGSSSKKIKAGTAEKLINEDFGKPLHCLIIPGKLHFIEEEALKFWMN